MYVPVSSSRVRLATRTDAAARSTRHHRNRPPSLSRLRSLPSLLRFRTVRRRRQLPPLHPPLSTCPPSPHLHSPHLRLLRDLLRAPRLPCKATIPPPSLPLRLWRHRRLRIRLLLPPLRPPSLHQVRRPCRRPTCTRSAARLRPVRPGVSRLRRCPRPHRLLLRRVLLFRPSSSSNNRSPRLRRLLLQPRQRTARPRRRSRRKTRRRMSRR